MKLCRASLVPIALLGLAAAIESPLLADDTAKTLYLQGKYSDALESLKSSGFQGASDYYNAGNCYFQMGKLGQAVAYFEKAHALSPGDADVAFNLRLATGSIERANGLPKNQSLWGGTLLPLFRAAPEPLVDFVCAAFLFALAWSARAAKRKGSRLVRLLLNPGFVTMTALAALSTAVAIATFAAHSAKLAVVVADQGTGRSGPAETYTELFTLPAGTTVEVTGERREGWAQVRFSLGNVGWIVEKDLLEI